MAAQGFPTVDSWEMVGGGGAQDAPGLAKGTPSAQLLGVGEEGGRWCLAGIGRVQTGCLRLKLMLTQLLMPFAPWKVREAWQGCRMQTLLNIVKNYEVPSLIWALIFFPLAKWDQVRQPGSLGGLRNVKPFLFLSNCIE